MAGWRGLLQLYRAQRRMDNLGQTLHAMTQRLPDSADAFEALGQWCESASRPEQAVSAYERALELCPDNLRLLAKMERTWSVLGQEARAAACRERRLELESSPPVPLPAEYTLPGGK